MKKLIIKILCLVVLLLIILKYLLDPLFAKLEKGSYSQTVDVFKKTNKDSVSILIFGTSHAMNSYNPEIIDNSLGTYSFNFGSPAQKLKTTKFLIENILEETNPKVVVLDLFYYSVIEDMDTNQKQFQINTYSKLNNSLNKFSYVASYLDFKSAIQVSSPSLKHHSDWSKILFMEKELEWKRLKRGYLPLTGNLSSELISKYKNLKKPIEVEIKHSLSFLNLEQRNLILDVIELLKNKNVKIVLVSAPYLNYSKSSKNIKFHSSIRYLADSLQVNYLDFNREFEKFGLGLSSFKEQSHVNETGADILSKALANYIASITEFEYLESIQT